MSYIDQLEVRKTYNRFIYMNYYYTYNTENSIL